MHRAVEAELAKQPKVEGQGAGQIYMAPETARIFDQAEAIAEKAGDSFVTVERMLMALALAKGTDAAEALAKAQRQAAGAREGDRRAAQGPHRRLGVGRERLRRAQEICPRPHRRRRARASSTR